MPYQDRTRLRLRLASALILVIGLASFTYGQIVAQRFPVADVIAVPTGQPVVVPPLRMFQGATVLYGAPADGGGSAGQLGCRLERTGRSGGDPPALGGQTLDGLDRRVVNNTALLPLIVIPASGSGFAIACTGPYAATTQPMYLITSPGVRAEVPMAAYSLASLTIVLGLSGLVLLRRIR